MVTFQGLQWLNDFSLGVGFVTYDVRIGKFVAIQICVDIPYSDCCVGRGAHNPIVAIIQPLELGYTRLVTHEILRVVVAIQRLRIFGELSVLIAPVSDIKITNCFVDAPRKSGILVPQENLIYLIRVLATESPAFLSLSVPNLDGVVSAAAHHKPIFAFEGRDLLGVTIEIIILIPFVLGHVPYNFHIIDIQIPLVDTQTRIFSQIIRKSPLIWKILFPDTVVLGRFQQRPASRRNTEKFLDFQILENNNMDIF